MGKYRLTFSELSCVVDAEDLDDATDKGFDIANEFFPDWLFDTGEMIIDSGEAE